MVDGMAVQLIQNVGRGWKVIKYLEGPKVPSTAESDEPESHGLWQAGQEEKFRGSLESGGTPASTPATQGSQTPEAIDGGTGHAS